MKLFLVRHAQTEWNRQGRLQGRLDSPRSQRGMQQAQRVSALFADTTFSMVYTSPSQRCVTTCERFTKQYHTLDMLQEQCFGQFEGKCIADIEANYPDIMSRIHGHAPEEKLCSESESFSDVQQRGQAFLDFLRQNHAPSGTILTISHGNFIKALLALTLDEPNDRLTHLNCAYSEIDIRVDTIDVIRLGVATHLSNG